MGRIGKPHGVRGDVTLVAFTDHPERFVPGAVFGTMDEPTQRLEIDSIRAHKEGFIARFHGVEDRNGAESLRGITLTIPAEERRELEEDEYWPDDLRGMAVLDPLGNRIGTVQSVVLGAQDRIVVALSDGGEVEVPFVPDIVAEVHPSGGFLVVDAPEGLL